MSLLTKVLLPEPDGPLKTNGCKELILLHSCDTANLLDHTNKLSDTKLINVSLVGTGMGDQVNYPGV